MHFVAKCWFSLNQVVLLLLILLSSLHLVSAMFSSHVPRQELGRSSRTAGALTHSMQILTRRGKERLSVCLSPRISFPASENTFSFPRRFRGRQCVYFHLRANLLNIFLVTGVLLLFVWYNKRRECLMFPSELSVAAGRTLQSAERPSRAWLRQGAKCSKEPCTWDLTPERPHPLPNGENLEKGKSMFKDMDVILIVRYAKGVFVFLIFFVTSFTFSSRSYQISPAFSDLMLAVSTC